MGAETGREPAGGRLRADARRNRELVIEAARALFIEHGLGVPMEDIARRAGVGTGTLYRRFPDRGSLVAAVAAANLQRILAEVRRALEEEPDAWTALLRLVYHSEELRLGLRLSLAADRSHPAVHSPAAARTRAALAGLLERLVREAQAQGRVRTDIGAGDVLVLMSMILDPHRLPGFTDDGGAVDRYLGIMLDALRPESASPLPGRPHDLGALLAAVPGRAGEGPTASADPAPG